MKRESSGLTEAVANQLQQRALEEIEAQGLNEKELADKLNLFPAGARRILSYEQWPIENSLRVLGALGVSIEVSFPDKE